MTNVDPIIRRRRRCAKALRGIGLHGGRAPTRETWQAMMRASKRLGFRDVQTASMAGCLADILSEAIEEQETETL